MEKFTQHVIDSGAPNQVIIDCSSSERVAGRGLHSSSSHLNLSRF